LTDNDVITVVADGTLALITNLILIPKYTQQF